MTIEENNNSHVSNVAGAWYDPSLSGLGFNMVDTGNGVFVYYYGYKSTGEPLWLLSTETIPSGMEADKDYIIKMSEPTNDEGANFTTRPSGSGIKDWGSMTIQFNSCTTGSVKLNGIDGITAFKLM